MIVSGREIAKELRKGHAKQVAGLPRAPKLLVIQVGDDPASSSFVRIKKRYGEKAGFVVDIEKFAEDMTTEELVLRIKQANADDEIAGMLVQLPLPAHMDAAKVVNAIEQRKDPDLLSDKAEEVFEKGDSLVLPPVAGAVKTILEHEKVELSGKKIVVVGAGKLVGAPVMQMFQNMGLEPSLVDIDTPDPDLITKEADIIVTGVGKAGLITPEKIKEGVILIDAGTSEDPGKQGDSDAKSLSGDVDPACEAKAAWMTPVPGGVGPVAVATVFENLLKLVSKV